MKKVSIVLSILFITIVWSFYSKPSFTGKNKALRELLWDWNNTEDALEHYDLAIRIGLYNAFNKNKKSVYSELDSEEKETLNTAFEYLQSINDLASEFERKLNREQVSHIVSKNKKSIFRKLNFFTTSMKSKDCSRIAYDRLKSKYTVELIHANAQLVAFINTQTESSYSKGYAKKIIDMIHSNDSYNDKYSLLAKTYYHRIIYASDFSKKFTKDFYGDDFKLETASLLQDTRDSIAANGIEVDRIDDLVFEMTKLAPKCLFGVAGTRTYSLKDLFVERSLKILNGLESLRDDNKEMPTDIDTVYSFIGVSFNDGETDFYLKNRNNSLLLMSVGEDLEENSSDDIKHGETIWN
jgi:hypothetical protein